MKDLPYRIAALCYLFDQDDQVLLIHRVKPPNRDLYSPVGGKLETQLGESPTACAAREIAEETGVQVSSEELHLTGIISEKAFNQETHWLMFLYEVTHPVEVSRMSIQEGRLEWHSREAIDALPIPETDREVIWPMFWKYRGGFFAAHIDCSTDTMTWSLEQSSPPC